jgi:hypothetical protein
MDDDDKFAAHLASDDAPMTPAERAEVDRMRVVLANAAVWLEPGPELQEQIVAAIAAEAEKTRDVRRWRRYAVPAAAAAIVLALGAAVGVQLNREDPVQFQAAMSGTELAPGVAGDVTLVKTTSGWRIHLEATGLPRRADGEFYEAWLKNDDGLLIPIGTFNDGNDVTLWSGAGPADFPTLTVTREVADGNQASSGQVVLIGKAKQD